MTKQIQTRHVIANERGEQSNLISLRLLRRLRLLAMTSLSLAWLTLTQAVCLGATYYLDAVNGDDANPGTSAAPWQTLAKAQSVVVEGDIVLLRSGNYGEFVDSITNRTDWVTYKLDTGHTPVFSYISLWHTEPYDKYLRFEGITVTPGYLHPTFGYYRAVSIRAGEHIKFIDMNFIGIGYADGDDSAALYMREGNDITIDNCEVYGNGSEFRSAFENGVYSRFSHNVTINACDITGCQHGISAWGRNWTITNNHLHDLDSDGILAQGICDSLIADNIVHDVRIPPGTIYHADGIQFYYTNSGNAHDPSSSDHVYMKDITVSSNIIYNIGRQGIFMNFGDYAGDPPDAQNITIENNLIYSCDTEKIGAFHFVSFNNANQIFRNNVVTDSAHWRDGSEVNTVSGNLLEIGKFWDGVPEPTYHDYNIVWDWWGLTKGTHSVETRWDWNDPDKSLWQELFADYDNDNYHLSSGSNAIDYMPLSGTFGATTMDLEGNSRIDIPGVGNDGKDYADAGCYEYVKLQRPDKPEDKIEVKCYNNVINPTKEQEALIWVELSKPARVKVDLYNTRGNRIRKLADEESDAEICKYYWDGKDDNGNVVGSGLYFVHIQAGDYKKTKKIVVVK